MTDLAPLRYHPDALTPEWFTTVLGEGGHLTDGVVSEARVAPLGTGQVADSVRIHLRYDGPQHGPETLVAKLAAADPTSRATATRMGNYAKEVRFYQDLADSLDVTVPALYFADLDATGSDFVLLLADAAPAGQGDQLAGCSIDVAVAAVDELVGLHAPRWGDPSLTDLEWLHGDPVAGTAFLLELLPTLWTGFQDRYGDRYSPTVAQQGAIVIERLEAFLAATRGQDDAVSTVTHGDYRLDNLLIHPDLGTPNPVTVVDWQTVSHGVGVVDLAYFVGAGLVADERADHEEALVDRYGDGLAAAGVDLDRAGLWDGYRRGSYSGLLMAISASMMVERTERGDAMFMTMAERHAAQAATLEAPDLLV